jgi:hypothetical protein
VGPVATIQAALPELVPGWFVRNPEFHQAVGQSLIYIGMPERIASEVVGG